MSPVCILGVNINRGQEITLRLCTDDLLGFRPFERIRETLIHELAHMEVSDHNNEFKALNSALTREAAAADWTKGQAHRLGLLPKARVAEESAPAAAPLRVVGGVAPTAPPRELAAKAAIARASAAADAEAAMAAEAAAALEPRPSAVLAKG